MAFPASRINPYEIRNQKAKAGAYGLNKKVISRTPAATQMANAKFQRDLTTVNAGTRQMVNTIRGYSEAPDSQIWGGGQQQAGGSPPPSPSPSASPSRQPAAPSGRGTINGRPTGEVLEAGRARIAAANSPQPTPSSPEATAATPPSPATPQQPAAPTGRQIGAVAATTARPGPMEAPSTEALIAASKAARISATRRGPLRNRSVTGDGTAAPSISSGPSPQRDRSGSGSRLPSGAVAANSPAGKDLEGTFSPRSAGPSGPSPQRDRSGSGSRLPSGAVAANSPTPAPEEAPPSPSPAPNNGFGTPFSSNGPKTESNLDAAPKAGDPMSTNTRPTKSRESQVLTADGDTEMARDAPKEEAPPRLPIATVNPNAANPMSTKSSKGLREHFKAATRGAGIMKAGEKLKTGPYAGMTRQEARKKARLSFNGFATQ